MRVCSAGFSAGVEAFDGVESVLGRVVLDVFDGVGSRRVVLDVRPEGVLAVVGEDLVGVR